MIKIWITAKKNNMIYNVLQLESNVGASINGCKINKEKIKEKSQKKAKTINKNRNWRDPISQPNSGACTHTDDTHQFDAEK